MFATAESDLDYMKVDREQAMTIHWSKALQWAQESLLCRDIFKQVCFKFGKNFSRNLDRIMAISQVLIALAFLILLSCLLYMVLLCRKLKIPLVLILTKNSECSRCRNKLNGSDYCVLFFPHVNYESMFQLCKDAVILKDHITVIRDGVLIASLFDNILLRVELAFHPFEDGKNTHEFQISKHVTLKFNNNFQFHFFFVESGAGVLRKTCKKNHFH